MKKIYSLLVSILIFIPFTIVNAEEKGISCNNNEVFNLETCSEACNFTCSGISGDNITFTYNNEVDYTDHFKVDDNKKTIDIINKNFKFDSIFENGIIVISDGKTSGTISIKNKDYKPTTTTTTTKDPNIKEIVVTLDPNNGESSTTKTCNIVVGSDTCSITLPKLETEGFNGWGTAPACKEGNSGSIKVEKDTTYYACYNNREEEPQTNTNNTLFLESLEILDKDTNEKIDYGTFSRRKTEYEFKVLYETENLDIKAIATDGIEVNITGNENLEVGENEVVIELTNENNETSEYKLLVTRLKEGEKIDNTHYLKSLAIGGYNIDFKKEVFIYNLTIPADVNRLEITAITENDEDSFEIKNNENLVNGSKIEIIVTNDDEEPTIYTINITKETKINIIFIIAIAIIALLVILLIVLIIIKSNKKKKNKTNICPQTLNTNNNSNNNDIEVLNI